MISRSGADPRPRVVLLSGGFGGGRLAPCLRAALGPDRLTVIANVGDDLTWFGLRVCPDVDTVLYALAGLWDTERGWGQRDETFHLRDALAGLDARPWFNVGDRDLALHILRADLLRAGHSLTEATRELARRLGIAGVTVLPASDAPAETGIAVQDGRVLHFQEWYVRERAQPAVQAARLAAGAPARAALDTLAAADAVILGPSNPVTSIGAILALQGMSEAVRAVRRRLAVSPVVARIEPVDPGIQHHAQARRQLLTAEGATDSPAAVAPRYAGLVQYFLLDHADSEETDAVRRAGLEPVTADLLDPAALARALVALVT